MLKSINIENFKSCKNTKLDFTESLCALIGKNGVGKTNILQAINWLARTATSTESPQIGPWDSKQYAVKMSTQFVLDKQDYKYEIAYTPSFQDENETIDEELCETLRGNEVIFERKNDRITYGDAKEKIQTGKTTPAIPALISLLAKSNPIQSHLMHTRVFFDHIKYYTFAGVQEDNLSFIHDVAYQKWRQDYKDNKTFTDAVLPRLIYMDKEEPDMFANLKRLVGLDGLSLVNDITFHPLPLKIPDSDGTVDDTNLLYFVMFEPAQGIGGEGRSFVWESLSVGTRRVLALLVSLIFDRQTTMLIEQPEDAIHLGLLYKLLEIMRNYSEDTQVVFATHSSNVLDDLKPEEVRIVTAPNGETVIESLTEEQVDAARAYFDEEGTLSDFLDLLEEV